MIEIIICGGKTEEDERDTFVTIPVGINNTVNSTKKQPRESCSSRDGKRKRR
jgi:hypothetical protein